MDKVLAGVGACAWGEVAYERLAPYLLQNVSIKWDFAPKSVLVAAFPYYAGASEGNLSLYARGKDYHQVVTRRLTLAAQGLQALHPGGKWLVGSDSSPLPEVYAGVLAGLGQRGRNGLLSVPGWGSFVFLGTIAVSWGPIGVHGGLLDGGTGSIQVPKGPAGFHGDPMGCISCGRCAAACPGGALKEGKVEVEQCLSHLTQKKGELTQEQKRLVAAHGRIWGCDICQQVCPHNEGVPLTPLEEFSQGLVDSLTPGDVEGKTRRQFEAAFPQRAFTWRGPGVPRRNMALREERIENNL